MNDFDGVSIKAANFKCFAEAQGFEQILPVNVIIGRNNAGKSTLLDLIAFATEQHDLDALSHKGKRPEVLLTLPLTEDLFKTQYTDHREEYYENGNGVHFSPQTIGLAYLSGKRATCELNHGHRLERATFVGVQPFSHHKLIIAWFEKSIPGKLKNPFAGFFFRRIAADRDVVPEEHCDVRDLEPNGDGATALIERFLNEERLPSALVEETLLDQMNAIFMPDARFTRLLVQLKGSGKWEIFLEEEHKGRIPMSQSGSGIKTVLLVLINLLIGPHFRKDKELSIQNPKPLSKFLFGFEELENNLHPSIQRRLFLFLRRKAIEDKCVFFLTTHSSVVIDLFSRDDAAQLLHIAHDGEIAKVTQVSTYLHGRGVIRDLGLKASDLLQSNAIVWVEGPSDRIYFNRWIELWTDGQLQENVHYQCVPYGGSLIAHWSFDDPEALDDMIKALHVNGHAIVLIDSDRAKPDDPLKPNARRVANEVAQSEGIAWITVGKEVENYVPIETLREFCNDEKLRGPEQFSDLFAYLDNKGKGKPDKVPLARRLCPHMTREMLENTLDLKDRLTEVCAKIRAWNEL